MTTPVLRDRLAALVAPRYVLDRELASGGMALVFLGHDPALGRDVAIKLLPPEQATAVARERFLREAKLLAHLAHPHVVPILEVQEQEGLLWFVMPRIEGDTLAHRISDGVLPLREVLRIGSELLDALAFAHSHGVIHRDVKPANVFLQGDHALLADFGVAQLRHPDDDTLTEAGRLLGTLRYMTPEQLTGAAATTRSDLYSLGATLYEAATGRQWSPALHPVAATWQGLAPGFAAVLRRALDPLPERRWPDAQSFRLALEGAGRRRVRRRTLVTGVAATGIVGAALLLTHSSAVPTPSYDIRIAPFEGADSGVANRLTRFTTEAFDGFPRLNIVPWSQFVSRGRVPRAKFIVAAEVKHDSTGDHIAIKVLDSLERLHATIRVPGDAAQLEAWGEAAADSLVAHVDPRSQVEFQQFSRCRSGRHNLEVWQAYWAARLAFQQAHWDTAAQKFQQAYDLDATFATALWYRNLSRQFGRVATEAELTELARHSDRLCPPLDELVRIQVEPNLDARMAGFDTLARNHRAFPPARLLLANELFHRGPLIGRPLQEGLDAFRVNALQLGDIDEATTHLQVIWGALRIGDERTAREALAQRAHDKFSGFLRLATEGRFRPWLARPLLGVTLWFADSEFDEEASEFVRMGLEFDVPQEQLAIGRLVASPNPGATNRRRASGFAAEATALLLLGRPMEALRQLDSGAAVYPADSGYRLQPWEWRLLLPVAGVAIARQQRDVGRDSLTAVPATNSLWPRAAWALAIDADMRGDLTARDRWRAALHARPSSDSVAHHLAVFADAIALGTDGKTDSALVLSRAIHWDPGDLIEAGRGPLMRALVYLKRGEWQLVLGHRPAADSEWLWAENNDLRGWPRGEPQEGELDAALSAVARFRRAKNYVARDERPGRACPLFRRVRELWRGADATFQPLRDTVQSEVDKCPH